MKRLALLLMALALSACATSPEKTAQLAEAKSNCAASTKGPSDPRYTPCVNGYLQSHYGWHPVTAHDRSAGETPVVPQLTMMPTRY